MGRIRISTKLGMPSLVVSEYVQKKRFSFVVRSMIPAKAGKSYIEVEAKTSVLWFRFLNMSRITWLASIKCPLLSYSASPTIGISNMCLYISEVWRSIWSWRVSSVMSDMVVICFTTLPFLSYSGRAFAYSVRQSGLLSLPMLYLNLYSTSLISLFIILWNCSITQFFSSGCIRNVVSSTLAPTSDKKLP